MTQLQTIGTTIAVSAVSACVLFFAVIGVVFVFGTEHVTHDATEANRLCDKVERQSGVLWCMNVMTAEDDV